MGQCMGLAGDVSQAQRRAGCSGLGASAGGRDEAPMRGALRTLAVLRALNVRNGATVLELARATAISRGALYRLLETLREAGYVAVDLHGQRYCLTLLVRSLADGFNDEDQVAQVARPLLRQLQKTIVWPVDLGTFMDGAMWIRETTRRVSPLTMDRGVVGSRVPLLLSASGRAYISHCDDPERETILRNLARSREHGADLARDPKRLAVVMRQTRAQGFGHRFGEPPTDSGAIAVPIRDGAHVLGCITMTFSAKALRPQEAAERYLEAMRDVASRIAQQASPTASN